MKSKNTIKSRLHEIIFEADTFGGKLFDLLLLLFISLSVIIVMLDSVEEIRNRLGNVLYAAEWAFTIVFTFEYILRIMLVKKPFNYIFSFFGIIDFLAIIPTYLSLFFVGSQYLIVIRALRLLRVFRVLKFTRYTNALYVLIDSLKASKYKIAVFFGAVITMVIILGSLMYLIEGEQSGFTSIPRSVYWAIVTLTTVGYGDIAPQTVVGQAFASIIMVIGYAVIAVPTGIITVEMYKTKAGNTQVCANCHCSSHDNDAKYCKYCGEKL